MYCSNMGRKRFEYIDAMRGFAILFIVFGHIPLYCYGITNEQLSSFRALTSLLQLPMFFFVSGYVLNSEKMLNRGGKTWYLKLRQLIIPAMFFCGIYIFINKTDIIYCITDKFKCGYWFTFTLFEFILIQCLWEFIAKSLNINNKGQLYIILFVVIALGFYILSIPTVSNRLGSVSGIVGIPMLRYYMYFVAGRLIHLNLESMLRYKYRDTLVSVVIFGFLLLAVCNWCFNADLSGPLFHFNLIMFELFALLSIFVLFYKKRTYFSSSSRASKAITFIGRRTLDIYLLHYFFLPKDLSVFGHYFVNHPAPILELAFCGIVTILVVVVCLIVSEILRQSTFCRKWLLGAK